MSVTADRDFDDWADILAFHWEAGVDVAIGEVPVDRFAESAAEPSRSRPQAPPMREAGSTGAASGGPAGFAPSRPAPSRNQPARPAPPATPTLVTQPPDEAVMGAREAARAAASLDELKAILDGFEGCALKRTASRLVFADGTPGARVMFVGEAPGRDEDQQGLPFVGRSGKLLDLMLASIGLDRTSAYIANVIPWRPPGNRTPTPQETAICRPFIERQIELADPDYLVCLGGAAAKELMATTEGILRLRGQWRTYDTGRRTIPVLATLHPAYLLRQPLQKRLVWRDLLALRAALDGERGR